MFGFPMAISASSAARYTRPTLPGQFKNMDAAAIRTFGNAGSVMYDLKYVLAPGEPDLRL